MKSELLLLWREINCLLVTTIQVNYLLSMSILERKFGENKAPNWIHSEMIFHDGKVYVGMGNRFFQDDGIRGTGKNGVIALNAETGDVLWQYNTDGEVMPTPAYHNGAIYIATGDRHLYKLDPDSG